MAYASLFFVVFAISMMSLRPITGKIYDRKGPQYVIYPALLVFSLGLFYSVRIQTLWGFLLAAVLIGVGFGSAQPCIRHWPFNVHRNTGWLCDFDLLYLL